MTDLKISIVHKNTHREIEGAFNICGSEADLRSIAEQILDQIQGMKYGWVQITNRPQPSLPDTPPIGWETP